MRYGAEFGELREFLIFNITNYQCLLAAWGDFAGPAATDITRKITVIISNIFPGRAQIFYSIFLYCFQVLIQYSGKQCWAVIIVHFILFYFYVVLPEALKA